MSKKRREERLPEKWEPFFTDMMAMRKRMDEMFDRFFEHPFPSLKMPSIFKTELPMWSPSVDVFETDKEVVVKANLPGCTKKDIKANVENNILTIKGEKKESKEKKKKDFYQKEQSYGTFKRSLTLPNYANVDKAKASCNNGVLEIKFPKMKIGREKGKSIDIR